MVLAVALKLETVRCCLLHHKLLPLLCSFLRRCRTPVLPPKCLLLDGAYHLPSITLDHLTHCTTGGGWRVEMEPFPSGGVV